MTMGSAAAARRGTATMTDCHMPAQTAEGGLVVKGRHQSRPLMSLNCSGVRDAKAPAKAVEKGGYGIGRTFDGQNAANSQQKRPAGLYLVEVDPIVWTESRQSLDGGAG
jgi:hypothetical protein